jgi:hypothetical protein
LTGLFPNHLVRILVFPDCKENGLTKPIIPSPLREFYLTTIVGLTQWQRFISAMVYWAEMQTRMGHTPAQIRAQKPWSELQGECHALTKKVAANADVLMNECLATELEPLPRAAWAGWISAHIQLLAHSSKDLSGAPAPGRKRFSVAITVEKNGRKVANGPWQIEPAELCLGFFQGAERKHFWQAPIDRSHDFTTLG